MKKSIFLFCVITLLQACSVSYKFTGASIDYDVTKTIHISNFPNQAPLVYAPLEQQFNEMLKDMFTRNTRLEFVRQNADIEFEGEIVKYELTPMAVKDDAFASETRLTMAVRMRYRNNKEKGKDKEETFSAFRNFPADRMLTDVQDQLIKELSEEIVDQIFNSTMADW